MKKRIFLIVSSIVCCLVSLSLVIYTIVKATQTGTSTPGADDPTTGTSNKPNYEDVVNTQNIEYDLIVGDTFSDEILANNADLLPSILTVTENKQILAKEIGYEIFVIEANGVRYNYDVQVWAKGSGTSEEPYNIINVEDLIEYVENNNKSDAYFIQQADLDLSGRNWLPLGNEQNEFIANYDGNGYSISNMSIVVNEENLSDYVIEANGYNSMHLGFFGYVHGAEIKNVSIENAVIDTTAIDSVDVRENVVINRYYVGGLAGLAYNTNIDGAGANVSVVIRSSAGDQDGVDGAVGGLVGMASGASIVEGYNVSATINASDVSYIKNDVKYGANVAGLLGRLYNSLLKNCTVNADIVIGNYVNTKVAGAIVNVEGASIIKNLNVENVKIEINKVVKNAEQCVRMSGAIDYISQNSKVSNSSVKNAQIMGITCGQVSGFASMNDGTIVDCNANGTLKGVFVAGLVDTNYGTVKYTDSDIDAVNVTVYAQIWGAGVVNDNYGTIKGASDKTDVNAQIYWYKVAEKYFVRGNSMIAGIATINRGQISNLYVVANIYDAVNAGGAVGWVMDNGAKLENLEVYTTVRTIKQNGDSLIQTYTVGGVVAVVVENSSLDMSNIKAKMSVNSKAISAYKYTLEVFGVFTGNCYGALNVENVSVGVSVFANDNVDDETQDCARVSALGDINDSTVITGDGNTLEIYGNVNVNGTVKSIRSYPAY
ncbi:MAG: hypothetical protein J6J23_02725 [Clostridia bacterium]|nr:hypothetical protein [Clostridia bacterium]